MLKNFLGKMMLKNLFGDKPWFKSITAWGLILFSVGSAGLTQICEVGLIDEGTCAAWMKTVQMVGGSLTALGIRKASTAKNVE